MIKAVPLPEKHFNDALSLCGEKIVITIDGAERFKTSCYITAKTEKGIFLPLLDFGSDELELLIWKINKWVEQAYQPQLTKDIKTYRHGYRIEYDLKELTVTVFPWRMIERRSKPSTTKLIKEDDNGNTTTA